MSESELRVLMVVAGMLLLAGIYWFGRPRRAEQGRREPSMPWEQAELGGAARNDPDAEEGSALSEQFGVQENIEPSASVGAREAGAFDALVSLHVMVPEGALIGGGELLVAAEKTSLVHGAQGLYHRLVDGKGDAGPIFSMINRIEPGRFDLARMHELNTPGVSFFMTLPGPLSALEAWDRMLPAAQRLAGLLHAEVYDDEMNLLGRQRIASIRDELRGYDRKQEQREIKAR